MFTNSVASEPPVLRFIVQQFGVPLCAFATALIAPNPFQTSNGLRSQICFVSLEVAYMVAIGALLAFLAVTFFDLASTGRWVWLIPSILLVWALVEDSLDFSIWQAISEAFWPSVGEAGLGFIILTSPTLACISYSASIAFLCKAKSLL